MNMVTCLLLPYVHSLIITPDGYNRISLCIVTADKLNPQANIPVLVPRELETKRTGIAGDVLQQ